MNLEKKGGGGNPLVHGTDIELLSSLQHTHDFDDLQARWTTMCTKRVSRFFNTPLDDLRKLEITESAIRSSLQS